MQIHELNNYSGDLGLNAFLAIDNGSDTGKISAQDFLAPTDEKIDELDETLNGRIDNIIAGGDAPSAAEITDARRGADNVNYASLGAAIRSQFDNIEKLISKKEVTEFDLIANIYIKSGDGGTAPASGWSATTSIPIKGVQAFTITSNRSSVYNAFYDKNNAFISNFEVLNGTTQIEPPANACSVRFSNTTEAMEATTIAVTVSSNYLNEQLQVIADDYYKSLIPASVLGVVKDEYINNVNGSFTPFATWDRTGYIRTPQSETLLVDCRFWNFYDPTVTTDTMYCAFYTQTKEFISNFTVEFDSINEITIPANAYYYALSFRAFTWDPAEPSDLVYRPFLESTFIVNPESYEENEATQILLSDAYLKFATWNVGIFNDGTTRVPTADAETRACEFRRVIGDIDAFAINTQEFVNYIDASNTYPSGSLMPFKYSYGEHVNDAKSFSKVQTHNFEQITFTSGSGRNALAFDITFGEKTIKVINVHLSIEVDPSVHRNADIQQLIQYMNNCEYVILSGDFNVYTDAEFNPFTSAGYTLCNGGDFGWFKTWPVNIEGSAWGTDHLDNIIVSSNITPQNVYTFDTEISDHAPLIAELRID